MKQKKTIQVRVRKSSRDVLNELSRLSGIPVTLIIKNWTDELQKILDKRGEMHSISLLSICSKKHDNVITLINPVYVQVEHELVTLKMPLQTETSGKLATLKGEVEKNE